ncbi:MAG: metal ABC transporter permease [Candidatus Parabeggiatoa sp.]|nr:metal ABC transporter permease [Candidatus Parabeggiatoa sp.]
MSLESLDLSILGPAFLAGLLVVSTHIPLGQEVLARGIIFIDLAIAQIAGLGVIAAHSFGWETHGWEVQLAAISAALAGALVLNWTEKQWPDVQEAVIGVLFVLAASAGILLLSNNPHGGEQLKELLVGQILWVNLSNLLPILILYSVVLGIWFSLRARLGRIGFYLLFAVIVTASVQLIGVYLVFATLIIPALATRHIQAQLARLFMGYGLGILGYIIGLVLSALFDLPTGAVIVLSLAGLWIAMGGLRFNQRESV